MALKNSQYDMIMRDYEQKQLHSRDILNSHFEELYAQIPELQSLEPSDRPRQCHDRADQGARRAKGGSQGAGRGAAQR